MNAGESYTLGGMATSTTKAWNCEFRNSPNSALEHMTVLGVDFDTAVEKVKERLGELRAARTRTDSSPLPIESVRCAGEVIF